jgi:hypothetical protein
VLGRPVVSKTNQEEKLKLKNRHLEWLVGGLSTIWGEEKDIL